MKTDVIIIIVACSFFLSSCCIFKPSSCDKEDPVSIYEELKENVSIPHYFPLNLPTSDIPLPALIVGDPGQLSGACFEKSSETTTANAPDSLIQIAQREKKIESGLKAKFEQALIKVRLEASMVSALTQNFKTEIHGMKIVSVDPASVYANLVNTNCNTEEFKYFIDKRKVVTGGLKADSIVVKMQSGLTATQQAKLNAAIDTLNLELGLSFSRAIQSSGMFSMSGENLFFGALTSPLVVNQCEQEYNLEIIPGQQNVSKKFCDSVYTLMISRPLLGNRLTVTLFNDYNMTLTTGQIDIQVGDPFSTVVGNNRRVNFIVTADNSVADKFKIVITMYLVGISGE